LTAYVPLLHANGDINPPPIRQSLLIFALLLRLFGQLLALLYRFLNRSDHVESSFRQMVVFAFDQAFKSFDRVPQVDELAGRAGEDFCNVERLRQEALDLARARNRQLVLFRVASLVWASQGPPQPLLP
jgi:hypothetical protein